MKTWKRWNFSLVYTVYTYIWIYFAHAVIIPDGVLHIVNRIMTIHGIEALCFKHKINASTFSGL
jgi:hypothetical protein